jgi:hypothetical protein
MPTRLNTLRTKQFRINAVLSKINEDLLRNNQPNANNLIFNYFGQRPDDEAAPGTPRIPLPEKCRFNLDRNNRLKPSCHECQVFCSYGMDQLLNPRIAIGQDDTKKELKRHFHSKSYTIEGRQFSTEQLREVLACHYEYAHNKKRPTILLIPN